MEQEQQQQQQRPQVIIAKSPKSMGIALILAFFFGPLGLLYSSLVGGLIMLIVSIPIMIVSFGLGVFIILPVCLIWAAIAVNSYNKKLESGSYVE